MIDKWDVRFLKLAREVSTWSKDPSTKTGAVIVAPNKRVVSVGFNGFPSSMPDKEEYYNNRDEKYSRIIHCEMNAILFSSEKNLDGHTIYIYPFMSCDRCFVHAVQVGIKRFVAPKPTEDQLKRWGASFNKVKGYAKEVGAEIIETDFDLN